MKGPFSESKLRELAENVIEQEDALEHQSLTGRAVLFVHHDIRQIHDPQPVSGREGEFYKFKFEYEAEIVEEEFPEEPYKARFSRSVRINSKGQISAVGERTLLEELD